MAKDQARNQGGAGGRSSQFFSSPLKKCVGHIGVSCQKTLRPTWCHNLVTGLLKIRSDGACPMSLSYPIFLQQPSDKGNDVRFSNTLNRDLLYT